MMFYGSFVHIDYAKLCQANAGDNFKSEINDERCLWVGSKQRPSDQKSSTLPLLWTTAPAPIKYDKTGQNT